ncbi:VanZ family protein [Paenibacillus pini]|uniref:VanZ family protein n=1 Tax=Paenibacillus pini TaxID=669461 RepID=UPI000ABA7F8C|nr:VanZ family protein [Paenibacillus pini]
MKSDMKVRQPERSEYSLWRGLCLCVISIYALCLLYWMFIGFGRTRHTSGPLNYNVIPFETIRLYVKSMNKLPNHLWIINILGNIGVFVPFGVMLPNICKPMQSWFRMTIAFVPCILLLETMQMLLRVGSFDVDDVILNTLGMWIGLLIYSLFRRAS